MIFARKVWKIGVLTLFERDDRLFVSCHNRTYHHEHELAPEQFDRWLELVTTGR